MQFASGTRLGPYEIVAPIGAGGMGEVYRGRDTRLDRDVAIKILPSAERDLRERFDREARAISKLTHPNICTLFDVGHQDGTDFLVMELLEGESLADRIARGPLPLRETLRYGIDIAAALERAHREGIVHRDLKPGNVMLTRGGAKVLDFGLAKLTHLPEESATALKPLTGAGMVVGTLQYMAPEQIEGREAGARTDIFALGVILYEMAAGRRPFDGPSRTSTIAAILEQDPAPLSELQPLTPPAFERVVHTCLAKDPEERWQTAHDVRLQLQSMSASGSVAARVPRRRRNVREAIAWMLAAVAIGTAAYFATRTSEGEPKEMMQFSIVPAGDQMLPEIMSVALAPDGRTIAYVAPTDEADSMLWVRPISSSTAAPLAGTDGASFPFWSPDSRFVAFFARGKLKKVRSTGGSVEPIADAPAGRGGTWNASDDIVFAPTLRGPLYRVSASGGTPQPVTPVPAGENTGTRRWPWFLPDGRRFLFFGGGGGMKASIYAGSLDNTAPVPVLDARMPAIYVDPGYILTVRYGSLVVQEFDAKTLQVRGKPIAIASGVSNNGSFNHADFSASRTGMIVFKESDVSQSQLTWFDRRGVAAGTVGQPGGLLSFRLSPMQDRVITIRTDPATRMGDVWIEDVGRQAPQRITFRDALVRGVAWSPDGSEVVYGIGAGAGPMDVLRKSLGTGEERPMVASASLEIPNDWSPDGKYVIAQQIREEGRWDLVLAARDGDGKSSIWLATPFNEAVARFAPDGKWVAYTSDESGRQEVYVRPFPGPGTATRVSVDGGMMPVWRRDGREIFFLSSRSDLMSASFAADPLRVGDPVKVFSTNVVSLFQEVQAFDVSRDGERFLINTRVGSQPPRKINVLVNWTAAIE